jgi:intracellular septation protein A
MGGVGGLVASVVPVVVFVVANTLSGLQPAIWSALGAGVVVGLWRLVRKEPLQPAVSGILGVGLCAFIAYRTGEARGFFLYGIWYSLVLGLAFLLSVPVRRPLVGVLWSVLNGAGPDWRFDSRVRFGYQVATLVWAVFFLARFVVQHWLYEAQETTLLGVARLAMGLPLTAVAALVTIWAIRRARPADAAA